MTASSHHAQQTYGMNVLSTQQRHMLCMIRRTDFLLVLTYVLVVIIRTVFGIMLTTVNYASMVYWQYLYGMLEVRGPTKTSE